MSIAWIVTWPLLYSLCYLQIFCTYYTCWNRKDYGLFSCLFLLHEKFNFVCYRLWYLQIVLEILKKWRLTGTWIRKTLTTTGAATAWPPSVELYFLSFASLSLIGFISSASSGNKSASTKQWKKSNFLSSLPELKSQLQKAYLKSFLFETNHLIIWND